MGNKRGLVMFNSDDQWDIIEAIYALPLDQREAFLAKRVEEKKAVFLGVTDKTIPELAIEAIKKGFNAKSFSMPPQKDGSLNA